MADVVGVRWTPHTGEPREFKHGRRIERDGYGDYVILDEAGETVATRKQGETREVERVYADE